MVEQAGVALLLWRSRGDMTMEPRSHGGVLRLKLCHPLLRPPVELTLWVETGTVVTPAVTIPLTEFAALPLIGHAVTTYPEQIGDNGTINGGTPTPDALQAAIDHDDLMQDENLRRYSQPSAPTWIAASPTEDDELFDDEDEGDADETDDERHADEDADLSAVAAMRRFWDAEIGRGRIPTGAELSRAAGVPPTTGLGRRKRREWEADLPDHLKAGAGTGTA